MTIKVALAGAGAFGIKHLDGIKNIPDVEVISLVSRELVTESRDGGTVTYALGGARAGLDAAVSTLAHVVADSRLTVIRIMNANAVERLRTKAARAFSDAFLMRTRRDNG